DVADAAAIAAVCSRENGTSITGALDDISCALYGGVTLTDNRLDRIILRHPVMERPILICYPKYERRITSRIDISSIRRAGPSIKPLRALVEGGFYYEAMVLNGLIHGSIFGYDHHVLSYLLQSGSEYASISGKGPAMFAVYDKQDLLDDALRRFSRKGYELVATRFSNAPAQVEP
ncbi:shikimate kinase, partial [mine drainage metagenome]